MSNIKKNGNTAQMMDYQFPQPKEKQSFFQFLYNSKDGTYLGRTPSSWAKILFFYVVFYTVLSGMFAVCMQGLYSTLSDSEPKWKLDKSLIGTNPGLGYRPMADEMDRGAVIQFSTKKPEEGLFWKRMLDDFLEPYKGTGKRQKECTFNETHDPNQVCIVDINNLGNCSPENNYGYLNGRPCVFLKLNKIFDWYPEYYDNPNDVPEDMPSELKEHIGNTTETERKQIWVSCKGLHTVDEENVGSIAYYPSQGFPFYHYPYLNQPGYLSPFIAVQFEKLKIGTMVNVECRAWARNILYNGSFRDRKGSVTFQFLVD